MDSYKNLGGNSGIIKYETGPDFIKVQFYENILYLYTYASAGADNVEIMKHLAYRGVGLNSFINRNVYKKYEKKYKISQAYPENLIKGIIVQLNSGGPEMTCISEIENNSVTCAWFSDGRMEKESIPIEALSIISKCEKVIYEEEDYL